jgi:hypothetical protein
MMPPRRVTQRLSWPGEEAAPLPSTQSLPHITEGQEIEAFFEIKEVDLQHAANVVGTSAGATGSSQNARGASHQSPQWVPSPAQVVQEHEQPGQHQVKDWSQMTKPLWKRSWLECNKRSRGFVKSKKLLPEGTQWLSGPKHWGSTLIGKAQV